jgi:mRNA interferase HigB
MKVLQKSWLALGKEKYPDAAKAIEAWLKAAESAQWKHFMEVKQTSNSVSAVDEFVIFNIRGNNYRLVTVIRYPLGLIFVRSFLTHEQYDNRANWEKGVL